ncbi:hypothetical protein OV208_04795 [Corallococcus sp. bb12-1]|uniref:hypothetical protein n=1 Tax=Corallococcus sp. bb12-1 TaxID=2996784 RepID=UPI002271CB36|nr:hypothetical protein [Corallococcus sp. bb12-1]MCY1040632.1 hypothetical protein [Corallococcus sp. bb12-1]
MPKSKVSNSGLGQSHSYRRGNRLDVKTIIVLAAGGRREEDEGRPAAGQVRVTLHAALRVWHALSPDCFPSLELDDYTIVNAVKDVHYKRKTGRTEGTKKEICAESNLRRMRGILADYDCIAAFGVSAMTAVDAAGFEASCSGFHPSLQALNRTYKSSEKSAAARGADRVSQWANSVMA